MHPLALVTFLLFLGGGPASAETCRRADAPPGVRVSAASGCIVTPAKRQPSRGPSHLRAAPERGFIDLGNGSHVRVGGRVRVDAATRR